ncbi:MAG: hypothetical protein WKF83_15055 [Nocardioidaceae bacterium]
MRTRLARAADLPAVLAMNQGELDAVGPLDDDRPAATRRSGRAGAGCRRRRCRGRLRRHARTGYGLREPQLPLVR